MKNQVTSIGQSKRLIELGVPAEKASMVWHRMFRDKKTGYTEWALKIGPIQKFPQLEVLQIIPAFTVADMLILLSDMAEKCGVSIRIHQEVGSICYVVYVDDCLIFPYEERSFVDMLVQGIIYLEPKYSKCYKS
ncbi:hypothetical protein [Alistipes putredinis]|jgi:hypothetical protein|uniref:hypothetical protein n=1 Tax=Alistipes putredinis TaxID=28117 RepID=UPI003AB5AF54